MTAMHTGTENWWESEAELLHPTAPLPEDRLFPAAMVLPAQLAVTGTSRAITITYPLPVDMVACELAIHAGRLVVTSEGPGHSRFARATTLPDNLDHSRARIRFGRAGLEVVYPFHPVAACRRRWRLFKAWLRALVSRIFG